MHEHARPGDAGLTRRDERGERRAGGGAVEVGVGQHDHRRLAAELAGHADEVFAGQLCDDAPGLGPAGQVELAHALVGAQRGAGLGAESGDHVEDAVGDLRLARDPRQFEGGERRVLRRLGDDAIPRRERGRELLGEDQQRVVPRRDLTDDAERNAPDVVHVRPLERRDRILGGARDRREIPVELGDAAQLRAHLAQRPPDAGRLERRELGQRRLDRVGEAVQDPLALAHRQPRPAPVGERVARGLDRRTDLRGATLGDVRYQRAVGRIADVEGSLVGVRPFAAADEVPVPCDSVQRRQRA